MRRTPHLIAALAAGLALAAPLAHAEFFASSASSAGSASIGSLSTSLEGSSASSSPAKTAAAGDYRVLAVADADATEGRAGQRRVQLQRLDDAERTLVLWLPAPVAPPAVGATVTVHEREWGLAFAHGGGGPTFFVALADERRGDLDLRPLTL